MSHVSKHLEALKQAWKDFSKTVADADEEQHRMFADLIKEMDEAEIKLKRRHAEEVYEHTQ